MEQITSFDEILEDVRIFHSVEREEELKDKWLTKEQSVRDHEITKLLQQYVKSYTTKTDDNLRYRRLILIACAAIVGVAVFCCGYVTVKIAPMEDKNLNDIVTIITAYAGVIASTMSVVTIITKYIFPENEEQYITEIVKAIQENDLENKKVNINANSNNNTK